MNQSTHPESKDQPPSAQLKPFRLLPLPSDSEVMDQQKFMKGLTYFGVALKVLHEYAEPAYAECLRLEKLLAEKDEMPKELPTDEELEVWPPKMVRPWFSYEDEDLDALDLAKWMRDTYAKPIINNLKSMLATSEEVVQEHLEENSLLRQRLAASEEAVRELENWVGDRDAKLRGLEFALKLSHETNMEMERYPFKLKKAEQRITDLQQSLAKAEALTSPETRAFLDESERLALAIIDGYQIQAGMPVHFISAYRKHTEGK